MVRTRRMLLNAAVEHAKRVRRCRHNKGHTILAGEVCLVITNNMDNKSYCMKCAGPMLSKAKEEIVALARELDEQTIG